MTIFLICLIIILIYTTFGFHSKIERTAGRANKLYDLLEDTQEKIEEIDEKIDDLFEKYNFNEVDWADENIVLDSHKAMKEILLEIQKIQKETIRDDNKKIDWEEYWEDKWGKRHEFIYGTDVNDKYNDYKAW